MHLDFIDLLTLIITAINLGIAFVVVALAKTKKLTNYIYAFVVLSISLWTLATFFYENPVIFNAEVWLKIVFFVSYLLLISTGIFVYYFPRRTFEKFWSYFLIILISIIPSAYVLLFTDRVVKNVVYDTSQNISIASMGDLYIIYMIPNVLGTLFLTYYFWRKRKWFRGYERDQIVIYLLGSLGMFIPILFFDYVIPLTTGDTRFYKLGPLFVLFYTALLAYAILRTRFLELTSIFNHFALFIIQYFLIACIVILSLVTIFNFNLNNVENGYLILLAILLPILTIIFNLILSTFSNFLLRSANAEKESLENITKSINQKINLNNLYQIVSRALYDHFNNRKSALFLLNNTSHKIVFSNFNQEENEEIKLLLEVTASLTKSNFSNIFIYDEIQRKIEDEQNIELAGIIDFMDKYDFDLIFHLINNRAKGFVFLQKDQSLNSYSVEDIKFIESLVLSFSNAIERSILYEESKSYNKTLSQEIDKATKEIKVKNRELEKALTKERDMLDILGHELRTPLSIVRNSVQMLKRYEKSNKLTPEKLENYLNIANENSTRLVSILETIFTSTKIDNQRLSLSFDKVDMLDVVNDGIEGAKLKMLKKDLKLVTNLTKKSFAYADRNRTQEILDNLLDNAIKYTDKGSITIELANLEDKIVLSVKDTGRGISKEDIDKLGTKFFRTEMYLNSKEDISLVRPGGAGLGLYVVFNLAKAMNGKVEVESKVNEGTMFSIYLPEYNNQKIVKPLSKNEIIKNKFDEFKKKNG